MQWRPIDNMIASTCIQKIQKMINNGEMEAGDFLPKSSMEELLSQEYFSAWRIYFIDRMMEEYDKNGWKDIEEDPMKELEYDMEYCKALEEKEKKGLSE